MGGALTNKESRGDEESLKMKHKVGKLSVLQWGDVLVTYHSKPWE